MSERRFSRLMADICDSQRRLQVRRCRGASGVESSSMSDPIARLYPAATLAAGERSTRRPSVAAHLDVLLEIRPVAMGAILPLVGQGWKLPGILDGR
jgi:hypothetical protein